MADRDYYEILGVSREATTDEIKRAFRTLARRYHPDVAGDDPDAEARFKEIARAYETLSDPQKRQRYDMFGPDGAVAGDPFAGFGLSDLFDAFFGGDVFGGGFGGRAGPVRGPDAQVRLDLEFEEAVFGVVKTLEVRLPVECEACDASGCAPGTYPSECPDCQGAGEVRQVRRSILGQVVSARPCPACGGAGRVIRHPCPECGGEGRVTRMRRLEVDVPGGIDDGQQLRLAGRGPAAPRGGPAGDLYVTVRVQPHEVFERHSDDLVMLLRLPVTSAVLGTHLSVETLDGSEDLAVPPGTQHGRVFRLKGRGVPRLRSGGRGDLLVVVELEVPAAMAPEEEEAWRRLAEVRGDDVAPADRGFFSRIRSAFQ